MIEIWYYNSGLGNSPLYYIKGDGYMIDKNLSIRNKNIK